MTLQTYCAFDFVPFEFYKPFVTWLGSTAACQLPLAEWRRLWSEFMRMVSEVK